MTAIRWLCPVCRAEIYRTWRLDRFGLRRAWDVCLACDEASWDMAVRAS